VVFHVVQLWLERRNNFFGLNGLPIHVREPLMVLNLFIAKTFRVIFLEQTIEKILDNRGKAVGILNSAVFDLVEKFQTA
jgi:hypothetical protein